MKTLKKIKDCLVLKIKNYFFNNEKNDISHECEKALILNLTDDNKENTQTEEYLKNYSSTTRWQTV